MARLNLATECAAKHPAGKRNAELVKPVGQQVECILIAPSVTTVHANIKSCPVVDGDNHESVRYADGGIGRSAACAATQVATKPVARPWQVPGSLLLEPEGPKTDALQSFYQYERQLVVARRPKICFIVKELIRQDLKVWLDNPGRAFGSKSRGSSSVNSTDAIDRERKMEHSRALR